MNIVKRIASFFLIAGSVASAIFAVNNTQNIIDWWRLRSYEPSSQIVSLADRTDLNDYGRKLFYVHDPELLSKADFCNSCTVGEATIVLGCYISNQRIYLYNVEDERLSGIEEVTAAHEMLHAAYDRLSPSEKQRIDALLLKVYVDLPAGRIRDNIKAYEDRDKSVLQNELHSILGTEVSDLPKELEEHYRNYFKDRSVVVALSITYSDEFERRTNQIEAYDEELAKLNGEITRSNVENGLTADALQRERELLESFRGDANTYNQAVDRYNAKLPGYNERVNSVSGLIVQFNDIIKKRNEIAVEEKELVQAIDTRKTEL